MDMKFWQQKWEDNEISFHGSEVNPQLAKHFNRLSLPPGSRVFVPLCGKTLDIEWLLKKGYRVVGVELSEVAIAQLFAELNTSPDISSDGDLLHYQAKDIDIFVGDMFCLTGAKVGHIDAIYDRAALGALGDGMRERYASHLTEISDFAPQLLILYEYERGAMDGPPFSVGRDEVARTYRDIYVVTLLESAAVEGGLKGTVAASESVWLLE